jgi:hypothetical protein|tara:strand:+ start:110 stop:409 length:300 start_codon:yes stop_codon:yes gene_type:complete
MIYLKLNDAGQIVTCDEITGQIQTLDSMYTVATVTENEINIWGSSDDPGFIDSTKFHYPDFSTPVSSDIEADQITSYVNSAISFLKLKDCQIYRNDQLV